MKTRDMAQALGRLGGLARAKKISAARKKKIAAMGGLSRALSRRAVDCIQDNFRYLNAIEVLKKVPAVKSVSSVRHPLPTIHGQDN